MTPKETIVLFDADSLLYSSFYVKKENQINNERWGSLEDAKFKFDETLQSTIQEITDNYGEVFNISEIILFLEGEGNFRKWITDDYKANRKKKDKPPLLPQLKKWVCDNYKHFLSYNVETDDSIVATYKKWYGQGYTLLIASQDKDIRTTPCLVWDYYRGRNELVEVAEEDARYNFWFQMLAGDSGDNVKGIKGLGKAKTKAKIKGCNTDKSYFKRVYREYYKTYRRNSKLEFWMAYNLLKLKTENIYTPDINDYTF